MSSSRRQEKRVNLNPSLLHLRLHLFPHLFILLKAAWCVADARATSAKKKKKKKKEEKITHNPSNLE